MDIPVALSTCLIQRSEAHLLRNEAVYRGGQEHSAMEVNLQQQERLYSWCTTRRCAGTAAITDSREISTHYSIIIAAYLDSDTSAKVV